MTFRFKQFEVTQHKSAMKIGTDAVLLGAWAPFASSCKQVLDIGTGTGVLALMMAQRFPQAKINAIDLDKAAAEESLFNFNQSPWANRLTVQHCSLNSFCDLNPLQYDAILSNPPFYSNGFLPNASSRSLARDNDHMRLEDLFSAVNQMLSPDGEFALVYPIAEKENILRLSKAQNLFPRKTLAVRPSSHLPLNRIYILFNRNPSVLNEEKVLTLEREKHMRTPEYQALVRSFYL